MDHVASSTRLVRGIQRLLEVISIRQGGEHFLRRPVELVRAQGFEITKVERFNLGIVERVAARRPDPGEAILRFPGARRAAPIETSDPALLEDVVGERPAVPRNRVILGPRPKRMRCLR